MHTAANRIIIIEGSCYNLMNAHEIIIVESEGYYCHFRLSSGTRVLRISLKKLEGILPANFIRLDKSTIVNTNFIHRIKKVKETFHIFMADKTEIKATPKYSHGIRDFLAEL